MRHLLAQHPPRLTMLQDQLDKIMRHAHVFPQRSLGIQVSSRSPTQQEWFQERRVRHTGMACTQAGEEPSRASGTENLPGKIADGIEMGAAKEDGVGAGPGVGVDDEERGSDFGV
ncbi:hypothetical protein E4U47_001142 [Claviceps purpurea]|nr:hypothetical protein E4U47_001142 [Claviceps purpurea]